MFSLVNQYKPWKHLKTEKNDTCNRICLRQIFVTVSAAAFPTFPLTLQWSAAQLRRIGDIFFSLSSGINSTVLRYYIISSDQITMSFISLFQCSHWSLSVGLCTLLRWTAWTSSNVAAEASNIIQRTNRLASAPKKHRVISGHSLVSRRGHFWKLWNLVFFSLIAFSCKRTPHVLHNNWLTTLTEQQISGDRFSQAVRSFDMTSRKSLSCYFWLYLIKYSYARK